MQLEESYLGILSNSTLASRTSSSVNKVAQISKIFVSYSKISLFLKVKS